MDRYFVNGKEIQGIIAKRLQVAFCAFFFSAYHCTMLAAAPDPSKSGLEKLGESLNLSGSIKDNSVFSDCIILPAIKTIIQLFIILNIISFDT